MEKFYLTTPIYYVNDKPHIGHAYTTIIADVFARYYKEVLGAENVFFLTGTDEHGAKIEQAAKSKNLSPLEFTNQISDYYKKTWEILNIQYDYFFRTTDSRHEKTVQELLQKLYDKGYIYKSNYKGIYCIGCEKYMNKDEITDGKCPHHPNIVLNEQEEENYFFKLSEFSSQILKSLEEGRYRILPEQRSVEIISKIREGLNDISISRTGVQWGIPVPWDEKHTIYVWVDALFNYYSATRFLVEKEKFWPADVHFMAKDILWFHAVIWEALLLALEEEFPKTIFAHGFFSIDGQKMSKSLGNIIDPIELVNIYGQDGVRYLLLNSFAFGNDGDFSLSKFQEKYNADLANGLGNLVSRVAKLCEDSQYNFLSTTENISFSFDEKVIEAMKRYRPDEAIKIIWEHIQALEKDIHNDKPWTLKEKELEDKLITYIQQILHIAYNLKPFLPSTAEKIILIFTAEKILKPDPLFERKK